MPIAAGHPEIEQHYVGRKLGATDNAVLPSVAVRAAALQRVFLGHPPRSGPTPELAVRQVHGLFSRKEGMYKSRS